MSEILTDHIIELEIDEGSALEDPDEDDGGVEQERLVDEATRGLPHSTAQYRPNHTCTHAHKWRMHTCALEQTRGGT